MEACSKLYFSVSLLVFSAIAAKRVDHAVFSFSCSLEEKEMVHFFSSAL
mgnify:CR=1 FL=1